MKAGADQRFRQARRQSPSHGRCTTRISPPVHRRHRAVDRGRALRSPKSPTTRAFPKSSTAASRRSTRGSMRACWRAVRHAAHMQALASTRIDPIDILAVNLYPFEANGRDVQIARSTTRSRISTSAVRQCCVPRRRTTRASQRSSTRTTMRPLLAELRASAVPMRRRGSRWHARSSPTRRATTA